MSKLYTFFSFSLRRSSFSSCYTPVEWKDASVSAVSFLANSFIISLGELSFLSRLLMIGLMLLLGLSYIIISKKVLSRTQRFTYKCPFSHEIVLSRSTFLQINFYEKDCEAIFQNHDNKTIIFSIVCYSFSAPLKWNVRFIDATWVIVLQLLKVRT